MITKSLTKYYILIVLSYFFLAFSLVSAMMSSVDTFDFSLSSYASLVFLDFYKFRIFQLDPINFPLFFIFILHLLFLLIFYNKDINDIYNYYIMSAHRYKCFRYYSMAIIKATAKNMMILYIIDTLSFMFISALFIDGTLFNFSLLNVLFYLFFLHILLLYLSIYLHFQSVKLRFDKSFIIWIILLISCVILDSKTPIKTITISLFNINKVTPLSIVVFLFIYLILPIILLIKYFIKDAFKNFI